MPPLTRRNFLAMLASVPLIAPGQRKWCVLLIDCVIYPFHSSAGRRELENIKAILRRANELRAPVININYRNLFEGHRLLPSANFTAREICDLQDTNWLYLQKPETDSFERTNLAATLRSRGVTDLIFAGWDQHACVRDTVEGAIRNCYQKENLHTSFDIMQGTVTTPENYDRMKALSFSGDPRIGQELDLDAMVKYYETRTNLVDKYTKIPIFSKKHS
jgi:hypothetical protein